jgi:hypothetical protein
MYKKLFTLIMAITALLAASVLAPPAMAGHSPDTAAQVITSSDRTVEGTLTYTEVDGTVVIKPENGSALVVYAAEATKIYRNGSPAKFADLQRGDKVMAAFGPDRNAIEIRATGP